MLVHLDGDEPIDVSLEALERSRLAVGDALDPKTREGLLDADADVRVREAALNLLAHRARTRQELRRRLRQKGFLAPRVDRCLERLQEKGLLDDAAVAAAFVRDRLRHRPRGRTRLVSELRAKGVESEVASEAIATVFGDEEVTDAELAREAAEAWLARQSGGVARALASEDTTAERDKARRRLYGYLARRGFHGEALHGALEHARGVSDAETEPE
ncbi:MAG TPA: regulatory protein RecX [Longimicrobiales bacterium]|nr:regulatory protein RecX [Longimicrobiales bacterium]